MILKSLGLRIIRWGNIQRDIAGRVAFSIQIVLAFETSSSLYMAEHSLDERTPFVLKPKIVFLLLALT